MTEPHADRGATGARALAGALARVVLTSVVLASVVPASVVLASVVLAGCESRVSLGGQCANVSDCAAGLRCVGTRCREECREALDCPSGQRCVQGPSGQRACSQPDEEACATTEPCDPQVFAACRAGRCVTGCTTGAECASGACDEGACVEPISTGAACVGRPLAASTRTIPAAVLGAAAASGAVERLPALWLEPPGASAIPIDGEVSAPGALAPWALGVRAESAGGAPEVMVAVREALGALTLRTAELTSDPLVATLPDLEDLDGAGALAIRSGRDLLHLAVLRPEPAASDDPFAWVFRLPDAPAPLHPNDTPPTYPGAIALFAGPATDETEELLALRWAPREGPGRLTLVGTRLGPGNAADRDLPPAWGARPVVLASAPEAVLAYEAGTGESILFRVPGVDPAKPTAPAVVVQPIALATDSAPALARSPDGAGYRVLTVSPSCGEVAVRALACTSRECVVDAASGALTAESPSRVEATALGRATAVLLEEPSGARVVLVDEDASWLELASLPPTASAGLETLRLVRAHLAVSEAPGEAVLAVGGLYVVDGDPRAARVRVAALRISSP